MGFSLPDVAMIPAMRLILIGGIAAKGSGALWQRAVPESFGLGKTGGAHQTEERCPGGTRCSLAVRAGKRSGTLYCLLMVSVEPMDALMMAVRAAHWARLSCSPRKRKPERAARAGSRLMRMLNVREGRFFSAMISTP